MRLLLIFRVCFSGKRLTHKPTVIGGTSLHNVVATLYAKVHEYSKLDVERWEC